MSRTYNIVFAVVVGVILAGSVNAGIIALNNPSFEADTLGDGTWQATITDWTINGTSAGVANPTDTAATPAHGENVAFVDPGDYNYIYQSSGVTLAADKTYTLSAYVGRYSGYVNDTDAHWILQLVTYNDGLTTLTDWSSLREENGVASTQDGDSSASGSVNNAGTIQGGDAGTLYQSTLNWTTTQSTTGLGDTLYVRLLGSGGGQVYYDDVELSVIPEPASLGLVGLAGLIYLIRRRYYGSRK